jgi:hypothetical protein
LADSICLVLDFADLPVEDSFFVAGILSFSTCNDLSPFVDRRRIRFETGPSPGSSAAELFTASEKKTRTLPVMKIKVHNIPFEVKQNAQVLKIPSPTPCTLGLGMQLTQVLHF